MKVIPLRNLVRSPKRVKQWTRSGLTVRVTDNGAPLWLIQADSDPAQDAASKADVEQELDDLLRQPAAAVPLSDFIQRGRG